MFSFSHLWILYALPIKSNHNLNSKKKSILVSKRTQDKIQNPLQGPIGLGNCAGGHEQEVLTSVAYLPPPPTVVPSLILGHTHQV